MIQLLPGIRIKEPFRHSTYGRVKVKTIQLFLGKHILFSICKGNTFLPIYQSLCVTNYVD